MHFFVWLALLAVTPTLAQQATPVIVAEVRSEPLREEISLVGRVQPRRSTQVASESEGLVRYRAKENGQKAAAGEVLYQLVNEPLSASLTEAQADFALRKANYTRSVELLKTEAISEQVVHDDEYQFNRARAKLEGLEAQVSDLRIRAPFAGHIVHMLTEIGAWVGRGQAVAHLVSIDTVRVVVNVPERHVPLLQLGARATVEIAALGGTPFTGTIVAIVAEGYAESHTFPVAVEIPNLEGLIRSNMSAEVHFEVQRPSLALLVHKDALVRSATGEAVFVAVDGKAVSVPVQSGLAYNGFVAVEGDLNEGDLAVVRGNERLRDGQDVRVLRKQQ